MNELAPIAPDAPEGEGAHPMFRDVPAGVEFNKLRKRLIRLTREAIETFGMIKPGARWLVALSGGKDSYGLLALLLDLKWRGLLPVELLACNLDQGQPNFPSTSCPNICKSSACPSHRVPGHLFDRHRQAAAGRHLLLALLAAPARPSLPHRPRGGLRGAGARPSPRGQPRNLFHEPLPRRQARRHAGQAPQRRRRCRGAAAAHLLRRARSRPLRRAHAVSHHPLRPLRLPGWARAQTP